MDNHIYNEDIEKDQINHVYEFSNMQGKYDALANLYDLIKEDKLQ
jgi:hypothetical protein